MLLKIINFNHMMVRWCTLHTLNLGIAQWVVASAIYELLKLPVGLQTLNPPLRPNPNEIPDRTYGNLRIPGEWAI